MNCSCGAPLVGNYKNGRCGACIARRYEPRQVQSMVPLSPRDFERLKFELESTERPREPEGKACIHGEWTCLLCDWASGLPATYWQSRPRSA